MMDLAPMFRGLFLNLRRTYLNDENTRDGQPETNSRLLWKKDVPSIANRPAFVKLRLISNMHIYSTVLQKLRLNIYSKALMGKMSSDKGSGLTPYGPTAGNTMFLSDDIVFNENETVPTAQIQVEFDINRVLYDKNVPIEKTTTVIDPKWVASKPMKIYLIPVKYIYQENGITYYAKMEDTRSDPNLTPSPYNVSWSSFVTRFTNSVKGMMPVSWYQINIASSLGQEVVWDEINGATSTSAVNNADYSGRPNQSSTLDPLLGLWDSTNNRWNVQFGRLTARAIDFLKANGLVPEYSISNTPADTYLMLLLPRIPGHTLPTTAPLIWVDGGVQWEANGSQMRPNHFGSMHGNKFDNIFHEVSHELGALHAPYWSGTTALPGTDDPDWPFTAGCTTCAGAKAYKDGATGVTGWDALSNTFFDPTVSKDLMTYPGPEGQTWEPRWISDWLFELGWRHQNDPTKPGWKTPLP